MPVSAFAVSAGLHTVEAQYREDCERLLQEMATRPVSGRAFGGGTDAGVVFGPRVAMGWKMNTFSGENLRNLESVGFWGKNRNSGE